MTRSSESQVVEYVHKSFYKERKTDRTVHDIRLLGADGSVTYDSLFRYDDAFALLERVDEVGRRRVSDNGDFVKKCSGLTVLRAKGRTVRRHALHQAVDK